MSRSHDICFTEIACTEGLIKVTYKLYHITVKCKLQYNYIIIIHLSNFKKNSLTNGGPTYFQRTGKNKNKFPQARMEYVSKNRK